MEFRQGYWVELQKERFAGGVSIESNNWEGGLGGLVSDDSFGITGYVQYGLEFLQGRFQLEMFPDKDILPQIALGVPLRVDGFKFEPHLLWTLSNQEENNLRLGIRFQYEF